MPLKALAKGSTPLGKALVSGAVQARNGSGVRNPYQNAAKPVG
jgi:hypothetical protein